MEKAHKSLRSALIRKIIGGNPTNIHPLVPKNMFRIIKNLGWMDAWTTIMASPPSSGGIKTIIIGIYYI